MRWTWANRKNKKNSKLSGNVKSSVNNIFLKSKQNKVELFNNNLDDDKISDIKGILNNLRDIIPRKYRKEIKEKPYKIEYKKNPSEVQRKEIDEYLRKLVRTLNNKEKYGLYDRDGFDYYGIRDIENLFDEVREEDYYKLIFVKSCF